MDEVDGTPDPNLTLDFQTALNGVTSLDNEIRLVSGNYTIAAGAGSHFNVSVDHSLTISGGCDNTCLNQSGGGPTVLFGRATSVQKDSGGFLSVTINNNSASENLFIHDLTFKDGYTEIDGGSLFIKHTGVSAEILNINLYNFTADSNFS